MRHLHALFAIVALGISTLAGCDSAGPERSTINGHITFQGKPVEYGHIVFIPVGSSQVFYSQVVIINGEYSMKEHGPLLGENRVEIHGHRKTGRKAPVISGTRLNELVQVSDETEPYLPSKYNVASELTVEIVAGNNENIDFHLE